MKRSWVLLAILLTGCTSTNNGPSPQFVNGSYYWAGDAECVQFQPHKSLQKIKCYNAEKQPTGIRNPVSDQQLRLYQEAQRPRSTYQPSDNSHIVQPINYPQMAPMQVTPITPPGGNQVRCLSTGFYTNCR